MSGITSGKIWGKTKNILLKEDVEAHHVNAIKGGVCSEHIHKLKVNFFFVIKGKLLIRIWKNGLVDDIILTDGEYTEVMPNQYHLFEALEDTEFMEIYYRPSIEKDDIERRNNGYKKELV